jgi:2-polyprenyl-3-methyl-5-hydroxy-6-metoxy-1,4-benzoquinol methylase
MTVSLNLYQECLDKYQIRPKFLNAYLDLINKNNSDMLKSVEDIHNGQQPLQMHVEFVLTSNLRGISVAETIILEAAKLGRHFQDGRYFDIGTAYAGFCVAFSKLGFEVGGIEINKAWHALGVQNLIDNGVIATQSDQNVLIQGDFIDPNLDLALLGQFDIVTCNDVIEHVKDPMLAMSRIKEIIKPDGLVFFEIPNAKAINHITADGHYNLFGINLLPHHSAKAYLYQKTSATAYNCGEFYELNYYLNQFRNLGFKVKFLDRHKICEMAEVPALIHKLSNQFTWYFFAQRAG